MPPEALFGSEMKHSVSEIVLEVRENWANCKGKNDRFDSSFIVCIYFSVRLVKMNSNVSDLGYTMRRLDFKSNPKLFRYSQKNVEIELFARVTMDFSVAAPWSALFRKAFEHSLECFRLGLHDAPFNAIRIYGYWDICRLL